MDGGSSKCTLKFVSISQVTHSNNSVGNRSSDVSSHNHENSRLDSYRSSSYKGHNDRSGGRRRLDKNSTDNSNHNSCDGIRIISEKRSSGTSSKNLSGTSEKVKSEEEKVKEETNHDDSNKDHTPLLGSVYTTGTAYFRPGSITNLLSVLFSEVNITEVSGVGRAILAGYRSFLVSEFIFLSLSSVEKKQWLGNAPSRRRFYCDVFDCLPF